MTNLEWAARLAQDLIDDKCPMGLACLIASQEHNVSEEDVQRAVLSGVASWDQILTTYH